jgi:molybdopterin synthase sulfur carrier subunit
MRVLIPSPLRSYTGGASAVEASADTVADLLRALDADYPGFRFRIIDEQDQIREHIQIFVNVVQQHDIAGRLNADDEVHVICALSGGR